MLGTGSIHGSSGNLSAESARPIESIMAVSAGTNFEYTDLIVCLNADVY